MINISSNFNSKGNYVFEDTIISFDRIYCGISGNTAVILGEEVWRDITQYYLLADIQCKTFNELINTLSSIKRIKVKEFFWKSNSEDKQILDRYHLKQFRERKPRIFLSEMYNDSPLIKSEIELIMQCLSPKRLWFFKDSRVPAALQAVMTDYNVKAVDHPLVAALGYALTMLNDIPNRTRDTELSLTKKRYT